jgi:hypothetical protein
MPGTAAATRWRTERAVRASAGPSVRRTTDAEGRQLLPPERSARRHDDVDTCGLDALEHLDGAGNFTFKRTDPGDFLHEGGETE